MSRTSLLVVLPLFEQKVKLLVLHQMALMVSLTEISSREILTLFHLGSAGKNQEMSRALEEGGSL